MGCWFFWILRPFLGALVWAIMIVVATWPMMLWIQQRVGGRRWLAVTIMSLLLPLVLIAPLSAAVTTLFQHADDIATWARKLKDFTCRRRPRGCRVGCCGRTPATWQNLAAGGIQAIVVLVTPYAGAATRWLVAQAAWAR